LTYLLDVNILIALLDEAHAFHAKASEWFLDGGRDSWATCPITENGLIRVMSNPRYGNWGSGPHDILALFTELRRSGRHEFWPDAISLSDPKIFNLRQTQNAKSITDIYLLGLAMTKNAKLATYDRHVNAGAVIGGAEALHLLTP
jgi:uncharacterized protein